MKFDKYIVYNYKKEVEHSDLDLLNKDEVLGRTDDGWNDGSIVKCPDDMYWAGEKEQINIDTTIETLQKFKKSGCNYVEIMHHGDHHAYIFYGLEMREATKEEIEKHLNKNKGEELKSKKIELERMRNSIEKIEKEIKDFENK